VWKGNIIDGSKAIFTFQPEGLVGSFKHKNSSVYLLPVGKKGNHIFIETSDKGIAEERSVSVYGNQVLRFYKRHIQLVSLSNHEPKKYRMGKSTGILSSLHDDSLGSIVKEKIAFNEKKLSF
jgi:hypothetical protein